MCVCVSVCECSERERERERRILDTVYVRCANIYTRNVLAFELSLYVYFSVTQVNCTLIYEKEDLATP